MSSRPELLIPEGDEKRSGGIWCFGQKCFNKMPRRTYAAIVHTEGELFVAECSEVGTVSQGRTVGEAMANLREATELYLEEFE